MGRKRLTRPTLQVRPSWSWVEGCPASPLCGQPVDYRKPRIAGLALPAQQWHTLARIIRHANSDGALVMKSVRVSGCRVRGHQSVPHYGDHPLALRRVPVGETTDITPLIETIGNHLCALERAPRAVPHFKLSWGYSGSACVPRTSTAEPSASALRL